MKKTDEYSNDDYPSPGDILEQITYGMVEGGYMPSEGPGLGYAHKAEGGTRACLRRMADQDSPYPVWQRNMFVAMREDMRLLRALIYEVFKNGWSSGAKVYSGVRCPELLQGIPQKGAEERIGLYIGRFNPWLLGTAPVYREQLDTIPEAVRDGEVVWSVYHTVSELAVASGLKSKEDAERAIAQYPGQPSGGATLRDEILEIIARYTSPQGIIQASPATLVDAIASELGLEGGGE